MNKVGAITFHCADNFGAVLQIYSLQEVIMEYGFNFEIIDFKPKGIINDYKLLLDVGASIKQIGVARTIKRLILRVKNMRANYIRTKNYNDFRSNHLKLSSKSYRTATELIEEKPKYDYYITGSDQVWNPDFFLLIGESYFLDFAVEDSIRISYAASITKNVEEEQFQYYEKHMKNFDYISVREKSAKEFISQFTNSEVHVTLDPTLLSPKERWNAIATTFGLPKEKYILVYDLVKDPIIVSVANKVAQEYGCRIISYANKKGYMNWDSSFSSRSPQQFLGLFQNAEFIVTSSFHGTAFALIYNKPFYTIPHPTRGIRMIDLLSDVDLNERIIRHVTEIQTINKDIDYNIVNDRLSELRESSIAFLKTALNISRE